MNSYQLPTSTGTKMISLYALLDEMLRCYERVNKAHRNFFINEVPRHLSVSTGKNVLAPVLGDLFSIISTNPGSNCVRISANKSGDQVTLFIKKSEIKGFRFSAAPRRAA